VGNYNTLVALNESGVSSIEIQNKVLGKLYKLKHPKHGHFCLLILCDVPKKVDPKFVSMK
jgi:hypothetical protein